MATENVKAYLFEQTGIAQSQWKRVSKTKNTDGSEVRIFQDKSSGKNIITVETKDGQISMIESDEQSLEASSNVDKSVDKSLKLIKSVLSKGKELSGDEDGYNDIPKYFNFCFLEDANPDHSQAIKNTANSLDPNETVTSYNIFFTPKFKTGAIHLTNLLEPFLPDFLGETQEQCFTVYPKTMNVYDEERIEAINNGTIPYVPYNKLVATLEKAGFVYDIKNCMLAKLGGSQGAEPLEIEKPPKGNVKFCLVAVKHQTYNPAYDRSKNKDCDHITAILVDIDKNRDDKEKLINKSLKKYKCLYPGRIMNGMLPQMELVQLINKKSKIISGTNNEDRQAVYDELSNLGWQYEPSLASLENAQKWTLEEWAVTPMKKDPFVTIVHSGPSVSDHASDIQYYIWQPKSVQLKNKI